MKSGKRGSSLIEVMVILIIVSFWVIGAYQVFLSGTNLAENVGFRTQGIAIAREGIEAVMNIRDTNRMLYSIDTENCWNVVNYNDACIGNNSTLNDMGGSYVLLRDGNDRRTLNARSASDNNSDGNVNWEDTSYRTNFAVLKDASSLYCQGWAGCSVNFEPNFTRRVEIDYFVDQSLAIAGNSNDTYMRVRSIVERSDRSREEPYLLTLETVLTNWKDRN